MTSDLHDLHDWRGIPIKIGSHIVYHVATRGGRMVEGVVIEIAEGNPWTGKSLLVRPVRQSAIRVGMQPEATARLDKRFFVVAQLNATTILV